MLKVLIWTVCPTHHQAHFHEALRTAGVDLQVRYYEQVGADRLALGWSGFDTLRADEQYVNGHQDALQSAPDWPERVHVVTGCADPLLRQLAVRLSNSGTPWVHWSEPSRCGPRWWLSLPRKRWYARLVNKYALGAFAIGLPALRDFQRWGINSDKLALLPYSVDGGDRDAAPDRLCEEFRRQRKAFVFLGQLCRRKAIDVLLRAFAAASRNDDSWVLLLIGNDLSGGAYARQADKLGIRRRVLFRDPVAAHRISEVLKPARVLVLPSRLDGWGMTLNEGASMGLALVGSDRVGSAYHLIEPGINGFRVRAGSARSLAAAMKAYVKQPGLALRHGEKSLALFDAFTPRSSSQRFINVIESWQAMRNETQQRSGAGQPDADFRLRKVG